MLTFGGDICIKDDTYVKRAVQKFYTNLNFKFTKCKHLYQTCEDWQIVHFANFILFEFVTD